MWDDQIIRTRKENFAYLPPISSSIAAIELQLKYEFCVFLLIFFSRPARPPHVWRTTFVRNSLSSTIYISQCDRYGLFLTDLKKWGSSHFDCTFNCVLRWCRYFFNCWYKGTSIVVPLQFELNRLPVRVSN